jgi:hypothetical protein
MNTPLDIAVDIGRVVAEALMRRARLDFSYAADEIFLRYPQQGVTRVDIRDALLEEADAAGLREN